MRIDKEDSCENIIVAGINLNSNEIHNMNQKEKKNLLIKKLTEQSLKAKNILDK